MFKINQKRGVKLNNFWSLFWKQGKIYKNLAPQNMVEVKEYNRKMLSILLFIGGLIMIVPIIATPFSVTKKSILTAYIFTVIFYFSLFFIFQLPIMGKYVLFGLYGCFSIFFLFALYLSLIHTPHMRATILLGVFCITSFSFIDLPLRMNLFVIFWLILHTVLSLFFKPIYAIDDLVNCLIFAIIGILFGNILVGIRLESYEAQRLLTIEKETDFLTGLYNRRKLFETLNYYQSTDDVEKPCAILMVDIDNFRELNNRYGHIVADKYLSRFGQIFKTFNTNYNVEFYRYGGEEFVALAYEKNEEKLLSFAEKVRTSVLNSDIEDEEVTVSIGVTYCREKEIVDYEALLQRADKATFAAKRLGKNRVCIEK
jgi:diguanylate cyclase (GGDEF)-like protein